MRINAFLGHEVRSILQRCLVRGQRVSYFAAPAFIKGDAGLDCDIVVLDSSSLRDDAFARVIQNVASGGSKLVLWSRMDGAIARRTAEAGHSLSFEIVARGGGEEGWLRAVLRTAPAATVAAEVLAWLNSPLARLPKETLIACLELFAGAPLPRSVIDFARACKYDLRTLERQFHRAGLRSPSSFLQTVSLARCSTELTLGTPLLTDIAATSGFGSTAAMASRFKAVFAVPLRKGIRELPQRDLVERLANHARLSDQRTRGEVRVIGSIDNRLSQKPSALPEIGADSSLRRHGIEGQTA